MFPCLSLKEILRNVYMNQKWETYFNYEDTNDLNFLKVMILLVNLTIYYINSIFASKTLNIEIDYDDYYGSKHYTVCVLRLYSIYYNDFNTHNR